METSQTNTEIVKEENQKPSIWTLEKKALGVLSVIFVAVILSAWGYAMKLRHTVASNNAIAVADPRALVEVEQLRNLADSQIDNSRAFFLLGAQSIFEKQKKEKEDLLAALTKYEKEHNLPQVPEIIKRIRDIEQKNQEFFDQAMDFREKKTESKIVGQFFQSKSNPLRAQMNDAFDDIVKIHKAEIDRNSTEAREAAIGVESQIPKGMMSLTISLVGIFLAMAAIILRQSRGRAAQLAERNRLYAEAKRAVKDRDEAIFAISHDLKESLETISTTAERLATSPQGLDIVESSELVKSTVTTIEGLIKDIRDQKAVEMEGITLRLDQLPIDDVLETARLLMQPLAKSRDVRIQVDTVNPPVLAFYDRERVLRVLSNLVSNSIKFSPKGSKVVVKVRSDQKFVNISVVDTGAGIPSDQIPGIFDNFWQARKTADQGAGVGLAIVKTIVEAHGGTVQVQSQLGRGTTFTFSLPRRRPAGAPMKKSTLTIRSTAMSGLQQDQ
ncbi:MAG: HAMP domain-containing histidine kinase [Bdellovibrionales bacterium]|nr:HAMP domain-containing histidine kinase [Bdellovibrionales bacterium]